VAFVSQFLKTAKNTASWTPPAHHVKRISNWPTVNALHQKAIMSLTSIARLNRITERAWPAESTTLLKMETVCLRESTPSAICGTNEKYANAATTTTGTIWITTTSAPGKTRTAPKSTSKTDNVPNVWTAQLLITEDVQRSQLKKPRNDFF